MRISNATASIIQEIINQIDLFVELEINLAEFFLISRLLI